MSITFKVDDVKKAEAPLTTIPTLDCITSLINKDSTLGFDWAYPNTTFIKKLENLKEKEKKNFVVPEACSNKDQQLVSSKFHGFVATIQAAYNDHRSLILSPDTVWVTIAQGLANHISENAEALRKQFVSHEGKKFIEVQRDNLIKGSPDNNWEGCFDEFSDKLSEHIGKKRDLIVSNFSTTTPMDKAVSEIVLMDAMKSYFDYGMKTCCGIPEITLEGTVEDWKDIRNRVSAMSEFDLIWWTNPLGDILDQFVSAARGKTDTTFWKDFFKRQDYGSGGPFITGQIVNFFPYLKNYKSSFRRNTVVGTNHLSITDDQLPSALSSVPFVWNYYGTQYNMEFIGGIVGSEQMEDLSLKPKMGWAVRDEIPKNDK